MSVYRFIVDALIIVVVVVVVVVVVIVVIVILVGDAEGRHVLTLIFGGRLSLSGLCQWHHGQS